jgi:hypothetical protein
VFASFLIHLATNPLQREEVKKGQEKALAKMKKQQSTTPQQAKPGDAKQLPQTPETKQQQSPALSGKEAKQQPLTDGDVVMTQAAPVAAGPGTASAPSALTLTLGSPAVGPQPAPSSSGGGGAAVSSVPPASPATGAVPPPSTPDKV